MDNKKTDTIDNKRFADLEFVLNPILPTFGEVDVYEIPEVKKIVTKALKAHKLKFKFDDETGNFIIPIIAGVAIIAEFGKETRGIYECGVGLNTETLEYGSENTMHGQLSFSPEAIDRYIPTLEAIISKTEEFLQPFIVAETESKDFKDMVTREIASRGLKDVVVAQLEKYDFKMNVNVWVKDTYTLTKEIIPGLRIGIRFTPEDYKSKCVRFIELVNMVPETFAGNDWNNIQCKHETRPSSDHFKTEGGSWTESPEKMNYTDVIAVGNDIPDELPIPEKVLNRLSEMGFIFSFKENILNVVLSNDFVLCRDARKVYFKTSERESKKIPLNDDEFITILRIIAKASTRNGYLTPKASGLDYPEYGQYPLDFYGGMIPAIREFIPPMSDIRTSSIRNGDCVITLLPGIGFILPNDHNASNALWTFLGNNDAIQDVLKMQSKKAKGPFVEVGNGDYWTMLNKIG